MKWIKIAEKVPEKNKIIKLNVLNKQVCMVNHQDKIYAFTASCPHAGADISYGWCENGKVTCPVHRYQYNLENGRGVEGQGDYLKIYEVEQRNDGIYIGLKKPWWKIF